VELAIATNTHPGPWFEEDERTVMTALDVLEKQAEAIKRKSKG